ncbi:MAG: MFS transporter [Gammaproteobacteria bacterium]
MPYWRLSGFYFFYFATLGVLAPYWSLYLHSIGFDAVAIGQLMALLMVSRIVAPNVWGWVADHRARRMQVVRLAAALTVVAFVGVFFGTSFWWLALVMLAFSFFWNASLPLLEVTTMNYVGREPGAYGRVRLWGSLGFIVSVLALGAVIEARGPWWVLPALLSLMLGIWLFSLLLPESQVPPLAGAPQSWRKTLWRPEIGVFLAACLLMQLSHGPYYTFYSIYLESHAYAKTTIGALWAFGVVSEIGVFLLMPRLMRRWPLRGLLLASFSAAMVRWLLIGFFPDHIAVLILAQVLHGATFGSFHASAIQMVHRFFTGRHQHRGQALYGSVSFGIGGAVGSLYSGYAWDTLGAAATYGVAAAAATMAFAIAYVGIKSRS